VIAQQHQPHIADTTPHDATPHDTALRNTTPHDTTPHDTTPHDTTPHDTTPHDTTPHKTTPHDTILQDADSYFRERFKDSDEYRILRLVKIADPTANSKIPETFWELNTQNISGTEDPITQAIVMFRRVQDSLHRKLPLYFADAVERWASALPKEMSTKTKRSIVFDEMKRLLKVDRKDIKGMDKLGRNYLTCMEVGGAAFLYLMDCTKTE
jgi:hypothetical protein